MMTKWMAKGYLWLLLVLLYSPILIIMLTIILILTAECNSDGIISENSNPHCTDVLLIL